jgi:hypothetical protein
MQQRSAAHRCMMMWKRNQVRTWPVVLVLLRFLSCSQPKRLNRQIWFGKAAVLLAEKREVAGRESVLGLCWVWI